MVGGEVVKWCGGVGAWGCGGGLASSNISATPLSAVTGADLFCRLPACREHNGSISKKLEARLGDFGFLGGICGIRLRWNYEYMVGMWECGNVGMWRSGSGFNWTFRPVAIPWPRSLVIKCPPC